MVSFLTTRVKSPDKNDWGKLRHGLMYLKGAIVNIARKHKMNVGRSTESELVSIADVLGMIMW